MAKTGKLEEPLLSVIVPVYNTEQYLVRCIESLRAQTYKNIEIVIVDDCSPGPVSEVVGNYKDIVFVRHEKNEGLFRARITGFKASHGTYVAFLDSDDYVSADYYRSLVHAAETSELDIVAGQTIFENCDGEMFVRDRHESCFGERLLRGTDVRDTYYSMQGACFVWHTIWNKVYRRSLWDKCIGFFDSIKGHIIMTEDVLFSSILFFNAKGFQYIQNEGIHYCENVKSATSNNNADLKKFKKNINDLMMVFDSVSRYLNDNDASSSIIYDFGKFREYYSRMWRSLQRALFDGTQYEAESKILIDRFLPDYEKYSGESDHFFELTKTRYDPTNENIKRMIIDPKIKVVSFDVFDTLVCRDVLLPDEIFDRMENAFKEASGSNLSFKKIRLLAERQLRSEWYLRSETEDFSIDDIYDYLSEKFDWDVSLSEKMCELEKRMEIKSCHSRHKIHELFVLSKYLGKKIALTSDMYLDKATVEAILEKCDITGYDQLFLSSDMGLTKYSGNLYDEVVSFFGVQSKEVLHIGDNWDSDFCKSHDRGLVSVYYPKEYDVFKGKVQNVKTNRLGYLTDPSNMLITKNRYVEEDPRCHEAMSLTIRKFFDNGYPSFHEGSDYNGSPRLLGYAVVGPHLLDICTWIHSKKIEYGADEVVFLSRDGFVLKKAYDILTDGADRTDYIHCSRRSLLPHMVSSPMDLFDLPIEYRGHSPKSLTRLLNFCMNDDSIEKYDTDNMRFSNYSDFREFVNSLIETYFDQSKLDEQRKIVSEYYQKNIPEGSLVFDMGYSGRIPAALKSALGYDVRFLYVYKEEPSCRTYESKFGLKIDSLYDFTPWISGFFREYLLSNFSELTCTGITEEDGELVPVYGTVDLDVRNRYVIQSVQESSLTFIRDYYDEHPDCLNYDFVHPYLSVAFETMLSTISDYDRSMFDNSMSDDLMYGGAESISVSSLWCRVFTDHYSKNKKSESPAPVMVSEDVVNDDDFSYFKYRWMNLLYIAIRKTVRMFNSKFNIVR